MMMKKNKKQTKEETEEIKNKIEEITKTNIFCYDSIKDGYKSVSLTIEEDLK